MFTKSDIRFEEMAADPTRRRAAIADLSLRRTIIFWCAVVAGIGAIGASLSGKGGAGAAFCGAVMFGILFKFEADLRLLRVIDRLHKNLDDKSLA